ncbi:oxidoreductase [Streptomyces niveus]|uniref:oxidoreductase n=1 Tax=Streptomyces niveus TaxID=193462 RepID=UPI00364B7DF6
MITARFAPQEVSPTVSSPAFVGPEMCPLQLRDVTVANRVWMSPMAQYSAAPDGRPTDWHLVHYGARAVGGAGLIMIEATAVGPSHRCTAADLGLWNEEQAAAHRRLTSFISEHGAVPAIQLQAAGRKGRTSFLGTGWARTTLCTWVTAVGTRSRRRQFPSVI